MILDEPYYSRVLELCRELQSGGWAQVTGKLRSDEAFFFDGQLHQDTPRFCCLGVACEIALRHNVGFRRDSSYWDDQISSHLEGENSVLTGAATDWYGFDDSNPSILILCRDAVHKNEGSLCDDCATAGSGGHNPECTNTLDVSATAANDDYGCNFEQIAYGFARRWLGGVEALDATPQN